MITRPVRERSITTIGDMVENGIRKTGFEEVGLLSLSSADHTEIGEVAKGLADRYEGSNVSLSLPSTRVDAFNITLANEFSRNGRRSGLTFAPEGGSERMRKVINKMVTEEDLIRTVAAAYSHGWRQVKLYFMVGLPTETDEDVLQVAELAKKVIAKGREVSGRNDIRCTGLHRRVRAQAAHPVPVGRPARPRDHRRAAQASCATWSARTRSTAARSASATTTASPASSRACSRAATAGWARIIEQVWRDGGRFDGWSEHFSYDRWMAAAERALSGTGVDVAWYTTRERDLDEVLPWDHLDSGLDKDWLWADWEDALAAAEGADIEVEDCRWTPCYDCGVCPELGLDIQIGPDRAEAAAAQRRLSTRPADRALTRHSVTPATSRSTATASWSETALGTTRAARGIAASCTNT